MKLSAKVFLNVQGSYVFGPGRHELLAAVDELGSLRKAARKLGMSYRWAWGRLHKAEQELGVALLASSQERRGGRPKVLTPEARQLLDWYAATLGRVEAALEELDAGRPEFLRARRSEDPPDA